MAGPPRSMVLARGASGGAAAAITFTCPADTVTLVKSVYFGNQGTAAADVQVQVRTATSSVIASVFHASLDVNAAVGWEGHFVLNPTDVVWAVLAAGSMHCWISGAVLSGPPPFPPGTSLGVGLLPASSIPTL